MFIIDTNVLIDYPNVIYHGDIGITWSVLEELDRIKTTQGERAKKARIVLRKLRDFLADKSENEKESSKEIEKDNNITFIDIEEYSNLSVDN